MKNESLTKINLRRRELLAGTASFLLGMSQSRAAVIFDHLPWAPNAGNPPTPAKPGPWLFFSGPEGKAMEAIADRIIPPDPQTPGGKVAGCAVFVDRQLAGPYGRQDGLYVQPPFHAGTPNQGSQSEAGPAQKYREALALGGTRPLPELYKAAGARLIFDSDGMAELIDLVEEALGTLDA